MSMKLSPSKRWFLRCLPMWQPWATAFCLSNLKELETRPGPTHVRGPVLIYATRCAGASRKAWNDPATRPLVFEVVESLHANRELAHAFGAIIGLVDIVDSIPVSVAYPSPRERRWGNYDTGRHAWRRTSNPVLFKSPIPFRGKQGWMHVPIDTPGLKKQLELAGRLDVFEGAFTK